MKGDALQLRCKPTPVTLRTLTKVLGAQTWASMWSKIIADLKAGCADAS